jgi:guanylate kinase
MIYGISGKLNSGKDTVGSIIQYLTSDYDDVTSYLVWLTSEYNQKDFNYWQIKKFADKLKDITCMLIGCTREQLEDREFKEAPLGEEWNRFVVWNTFKELNYENPIQALFNTKKEAKDYILEIDKEISYLEEAPRATQVLLVKEQQMTPRLLLQLLGTECGRQILHPNIWVNSLMSEYKESYRDSTQSEIDRMTELNGGVFQGGSKNLGFPNWIITDPRFENEAKAVKDKDGIMIRVNRGIKIQSKEYGELTMNLNEHKKLQHFENGTMEHSSETGLDDYDGFNYVIDNDGTIEDLIEKVKEILIKENLI